MKSNSWIVSNKETGKAVLETYNKAIVDKINVDKYRVETAYDYLCRINREIAAGSTTYNT